MADRNRFLLWIDAIGGYMVCLSDTIVLGQASAGDGPDVPLQADLSRRHAVIRRDREGYVLEPLKAVKLDGRPVSAATTLTDGQVVELGDGVRLRFRKPHPLSATARLELASHHRTYPSTDGILLMADSCIVGPGAQSHVIGRDLSKEVVLYRHADGLACRASSDLKINGVPSGRSGAVPSGSRVEAAEFSFMLEKG